MAATLRPMTTKTCSRSFTFLTGAGNLPSPNVALTESRGAAKKSKQNPACFYTYHLVFSMLASASGCNSSWWVPQRTATAPRHPSWKPRRLWRVLPPRDFSSFGYHRWKPCRYRRNPRSACGDCCIPVACPKSRRWSTSQYPMVKAMMVTQMALMLTPPRSSSPLRVGLGYVSARRLASWSRTALLWCRHMLNIPSQLPVLS
mmetsp:Transcript_57274/g.125369  ORF Transcript_57274/g.125369 Transcript_57274/m.125369 type:complete len:202 (-) Transcript_57274:81-686(-)